MIDDKPSLLPAAGLTMPVACRTSEGGKPAQHDVTITPEWELITPHDLEVERIGVALGGYLTCVRLADHDLPATRDFLEHLHRTRPAAILQDDAQSWRVTAPASRCGCDDKRWPTPSHAAEHLRNLEHWARVHRTTSRAVRSLVKLVDPVGELMHPRNPVPRPATTGLLSEPDATELLWQAGVPFDTVPALCRDLSPGGVPIPTRVVLAQVYAPREWEWLEPFIAHGPVVLGWAAQRRTARDERRPGDRAAWVEAGVPLPTIDRIFLGEEYDVVHARAYASLTGTTLPIAAGVLGRWQESGTTPTVRELVDLFGRDSHAATAPGCAPPRAAVDRVIALAARRGHRVTDVDAALALARHGTAPDAVAHLTRESTPPLEAS